MSKIKVGIIYGGRSVEHDVSILSAKNIVGNIDVEKFDITLIGIDKSGKWFLTNSIDQNISDGRPIHVLLDTTNPEFKTVDNSFNLDVVFPILHGTDGEDGAIQGLLQTLGLPYVGSDVLGSAVAMDKLISKQILEALNIPVARYLSFNDTERNMIAYADVTRQLGDSIIVKPVNLGSSVGVTKVNSESEFSDALDIAFQYDHAILIEEFISGREVECAVLGNEEPIVSMAGEIKLSDKYDFYSFTAKYEDPDSAEIKIPAAMDDSVHSIIKDLSLRAYKALSCSDLSRVDLFVTKDNDVYVNEVNTLPGFTNISMYPSLLKHEGVAYQDLITRLIQMAIDRNASDDRITTNYDSQL